MSRFSFLFSGLLGLLGCGDERTAFNRTYSLAVCERMMECAPGAVEAAFGVEGECQRSVDGRYERMQGDLDCRYDSEAAEDCLSQTFRVSCEAWLEYGEPLSCASVYSCGENSGGGFRTMEERAEMALDGQ